MVNSLRNFAGSVEQKKKSAEKSVILQPLCVVVMFSAGYSAPEEDGGVKNSKYFMRGNCFDFLGDFFSSVRTQTQRGDKGEHFP